MPCLPLRRPLARAAEAGARLAIMSAARSLGVGAWGCAGVRDADGTLRVRWGLVEGSATELLLLLFSRFGNGAAGRRREVERSGDTLQEVNRRKALAMRRRVDIAAAAGGSSQELTGRRRAAVCGRTSSQTDKEKTTRGGGGANRYRHDAVRVGTCWVRVQTRRRRSPNSVRRNSGRGGVRQRCEVK
jgi:hypothetical protein